MSDKLDLHMHSDFSDGTLTPTALVERAKRMGYDCIALTDHDTVDGVAEAMAAGEALGIQVAPGVELAADAGKGIEVHLLGYGIDIRDAALTAALAEIAENRRDRNKRLMSVLQDMGLAITFADLDVNPKCGYVGKPVIARALIKKGYIAEVRQAFEPGKFLEAPAAKAVKKRMITAGRAIELIRGAGGEATLAHPMRVKRLAARGSEAFYAGLDELTARLAALGLAGMECEYADHTEQEIRRLKAMAEKYGLYSTMGSDYHGPEHRR